MVDVEKLTGDFDAAREMKRRVRDVNGQEEAIPEVYIAHLEGKREEVIRRLETWLEPPPC